jgi:N-carbamoylputrescine amidase
MKNKYKIALVQMRVAADGDANLKRAIAGIQEAAKNGAEVVCLPELFRSQYFCQHQDPAHFDLAEPIPGPTTQALGQVAREAKVAIVAPVFERRTHGLYHNSAAILDSSGEIAGVYRKMHIPDDPAYYEKFYFAPGDLGFLAVDVGAARVGTLICWDQWYPEAARLTALRGASVLFYPTAIGWHPHEKEKYGDSQLDAWRTVQRGHAIANGIYVAAVNRVGLEIHAAGGPGIEFWGHSFICDPQGVILDQAGEEERNLYAHVDLAHLEDVRRNWPFLRDRRVDAYNGIERRFIDAAASAKPAR